MSELTKETTRINPVVIALGFALLALVLRFWDLGTESFWFDEFIMVEVTSVPEEMEKTLDGGRPPLMVLVGSVWGDIFGFDEAGVRSLPAVLGAGAIFFFYLIAEQIFDRRTAIMATVLAILSGFLIHHSQDYRYYSMLLFTSLLSYYFLVQTLWTGKRWFFIPYVVASALVYYTHVYGLFVFVGQGIFFLLRWGRYKDLRLPWFISQVGIVIAIMPHLAVHILPGILGTGGSEEGLGGSEFIANRAKTTPFHTVVKYIAYNFDYLHIVPIGLAALILVGGTLYFISRRRQEWTQGIGQTTREVSDLFTKQTDATWLALTWFFFPMFTPFFLEFVLGPMYLHRYVIASAPGFYLLLALGLVTFRHLVPLYASFGALIAFMGTGLLIYYSEPTKEEWRELIAYIETHEEANDVVVANVEQGKDRQNQFMAHFNEPLNIYYDGDLPRCTLYDDMRDDDAATADFTECVTGRDRMWLILRDYSSAEARIDELNTFLADNVNAEMVDHRVYLGIQLLEYQLPATTAHRPASSGAYPG